MFIFPDTVYDDSTRGVVILLQFTVVYITIIFPRAARDRNEKRLRHILRHVGCLRHVLGIWCPRHHLDRISVIPDELYRHP